jgi:hypothetical protein
MPKFAYNYVDIDESTPRTEFHDTVAAEDVIDAALTVLSELYLDGTRASVYNMIEMQD